MCFRAQAQVRPVGICKHVAFRPKCHRLILLSWCKDVELGAAALAPHSIHYCLKKPPWLYRVFLYCDHSLKINGRGEGGLPCLGLCSFGISNDRYSLMASHLLIKPPHRGGVRSNTCSFQISALERWSFVTKCEPCEPCFWKKGQKHRKCVVGVLWTRQCVSWRRKRALLPFLSPPPLNHLV